ncbi:MAG: protease modulator HflC [Alkalispirochaetaceae bacterium]
MKRLLTILVIVGILLVIVIALGPFYVVNEGEQAVVLRFGEIVDTQTRAGLKLKTPVVDNVVKYSAKILSWDGDPRRVPTAQNQFIWVDTTARWQITDPELFYASVTTMEQGYSRLDDIIESAVRSVISRNSLEEAVRSTNLINEIEREAPVSADAAGEQIDEEGFEEIADLIDIVQNQPEINRGRRELSDEMKALASETTPSYGVELVDIVIRQIRYSDDLTESVFERMVSERRQIAQAYRSYGQGRKQEILGQMERERAQILSEARREAETIRGGADAEAAAVYSGAYEQDPAFFEFWRAVQSYESILPRFRKTLTTDMDYFRFLHDEQGQE